MYRIFIDPGHGSPDPGAVGQGGAKESDIVLAIALEVRRLLSCIDGIDIKLSRETDKRPGTSATTSLSSRVYLAEQYKADYFLSLHTNSANNAKAKGTMIFIHGAGGKAEIFANKLGNALAAEVPEVTYNGVKVAQDFLKHSLYVLKNTSMPAALIEFGFISNPNEEKVLTAEAVQKRAANAISKAILEQVGISPMTNDDKALQDLLKPSDWAAEGWKWAADNHFLDGQRPHDNLTREELAVILQRFYNAIK